MLVHPAIAESCACAIGGVVSDPDVRGRLAAAAVESPDLLGRFAGVSDGRSDQGRDHPVAVVLTLCAAAVLATATYVFHAGPLGASAMSEVIPATSLPSICPTK